MTANFFLVIRPDFVMCLALLERCTSPVLTGDCISCLQPCRFIIFWALATATKRRGGALPKSLV